MRLSFVAVLATTVAAVAVPRSLTFVPQQLSYNAQPAPLHAASNADHVPDSYIVVLQKDISATSFLAHQQLIAGAQMTASSSDAHGIRHIYNLESHLQGYSGSFTPDVLAYIRAQPEVAYVERDSIVHAQVLPNEGNNVWLQAHATTGRADTQANDNYITQNGAPWGLARVSHREKLGFGTFNKYVYDATAGEGVTAYIIDTGIYINHTEFEGRARWGKTMPQNDVDEDGNGHGTHCAGTIGSRAYGVAKNASLVAVKVLGSSGSGSMSDVTAGVLWAVEDAKNISATLAQDPTSEKAKKHKGFVANMSLGGGKSPTLDAAVNGAVDSGLHFAVAAGNENQDACNTSPASAGNPVTVGASTLSDERAYFSNYGKCVNVFAPGLNIKSTWKGSKDATNTISGTSMATPHVVGLLAYLLSIYGTDDFALIKDAKPVPTFDDLNGGNGGGDDDDGGNDDNDKKKKKHHRHHNKVLAQVSRGAHALLTSLPVQVVPNVALDFLLEHIALAPVPRQPTKKIVTVLHPSDLKKALAGLATADALTDLDSQSPNLLVFNNATTTE